MAKRYLSKISVCDEIAAKIHKTPLSEEAIRDILRKLYCDARMEGYFLKINHAKDLRTINDIEVTNNWKSVLSQIEDKIHGGFRNQISK